MGLMRGPRLLGRSDELKDEVHAIRLRRRQQHSLAQQALVAAGG